MKSIRKDQIQINPETTKWRRALIAGPGFFLALIISVLMLVEWIRIVFIASPKTVEKYYFGSEAMMTHGGWRYGSATKYAWSAFGEGVLAGVIGLCFIYGYLRPPQKLLSIAYIGLGLLLIFIWFT